MVWTSVAGALICRALDDDDAESATSAIAEAHAMIRIVFSSPIRQWSAGDRITAYLPIIDEHAPTLIPLGLDRAFEFGFSRLKGGQLRPNIRYLFFDGTQFGLSLLAHQVLRAKLFGYVRLKLAS
jgi:hypothetical protein